MIADDARGDAQTVFVMPASLSTRPESYGIAESSAHVRSQGRRSVNLQPPGRGSWETNKIKVKNL
jgi:hypothetical protein